MHLVSKVTSGHSVGLNIARGLRGLDHRYGILLPSRLVAVGILQLSAFSLLGQWQLSSQGPAFAPQFTQLKMAGSTPEKRPFYNKMRNTVKDDVR